MNMMYTKLQYKQRHIVICYMSHHLRTSSRYTFALITLKSLAIPAAKRPKMANSTKHIEKGKSVLIPLLVWFVNTCWNKARHSVLFFRTVLEADDFASSSNRARVNTNVNVSVNAIV